MPSKINNKWVFTDEELDDQFRKAEEAHKEYIKGKPVAASYTFDPQTRILSVQTSDGSRMEFPVNKIRELQNASPSEIQKAYITNSGDAIHWDELDAHYTVAGLAANIFGTREWMRELGRQGGKVTSASKVQASRLNGQRGGRPTHRAITEAALGLPTKLIGDEGRAATHLDVFGVVKRIGREVFLDRFRGATTINSLCQTST